MKKLVILILLSSAFVVYAEEKIDIVYLNNGSIIKGFIIEFYPDSLLKIETRDGSIFAFEMDEVQKITKETIQITDVSVKNKTTLSDSYLFGIIGGINYNNWNTSGIEEGDKIIPKTGLCAGLFLTKNAPVSGRIEILYLSKGVKEEYTSDFYYNYDADYNIQTISLLSFLTIGASEPNGSMFFEMGPEVSFIITNKVKISYDYGNSTSSVADNFTKFEFALNLGLGFIIDNILLDAHYSIGLTDLIDEDYYYGEAIIAKSRGIRLRLGVSI